MSALLLEPPMAADKPERPPTEPMRVHADVADMVRQICSLSKDSRGRPLKTTDFIDSILRGPVTKEHARVMKRLRDGNS